MRPWEITLERNSLLILFGTVTGNAESLAQRTAEVIARRGFNVRVKDMAHYTVDALSQESCVVYHHQHLRQW